VTPVFYFILARSDDDDTIGTGWNEEVPMDTFLKAFEDYGEKFMGFVNVAENPRVWQVRSLKAIPTWTKGNVALLGDAAHAMFPSTAVFIFRSQN
jgi:salicylate hydroxylase